MNIDVSNRQIKLENSYNTRDAGGYVTRDGRQMRWGVLFRSDGLHRLPETARTQLLGLGVRSMVDLRTFGEIEEHANPFAQSDAIKYSHLPIFDNFQDRLPPSLEVMYGRMFARTSAMYRIFNTLAAPDAFPTLVHCTAGKDRTGVVIALLQDLCGVPDDDIANDYAITQQLLMPLVQRLKAKGVEEGLDPDHYDKLLLADPVPFMAAFSSMRKEYGSGEGYLMAVGITPPQLAHIRSELLQP